MKLDINIRIFFSALFLLLLASAFSATYSYAKKPESSGTNLDECVGNGTGTITLPVRLECELQPDVQKLSWKRIDLCTADPAEPTTTAATGLANCSTFFRNDAGAEVSVKKGTGTQIGKAADYFPIPHGSYTHGIITMGTIFKYKASILFSGNMKDPANGTSATCVTKPAANNATLFAFTDNLNFAKSNVDCSANAVAAETTLGINIMDMDGQNDCFHLYNFNGTNGNVAGYLVEADGTLLDGVGSDDRIASGEIGCQSGSAGGITSIVGIMNFAKPLTIGPSTAGIQIAYNNTQGLLLDLESGVDNKFYKFGIAFFDFTLTPKEARANGAWR